MEVSASASISISIVKDGTLWGLIACHHREPKQLSYETRLACGALTADLSRQIRAKDDAEMYRQRIRLHSQENAVVSHLGSLSSLTAFLANTGEELCQMLGADGFAAVQGGTTMPLTPRASFDAWSEIVERRSAA
jgi:chemotaxis family two-component system sensor kinase Cph1